MQTRKEIVDLMLQSCDHNPYSGKLSKRDNIIAAISLAKLCKEFADTGQRDEAMYIEGWQWQQVITELQEMLINYK